MNTTNETPAVLTDTAGAHEKQKQRARSISQNGQAGKTVAENAVTQIVPPEPPQPLSWPSSFKLGHDGVYKTEMRENEAPVDTWICSPLIVEAKTRDTHGQNWGLLLAVQAPDGAWHRWAMPMQLTGGNGNAYREILLSLGLCLAAGAQKHLHTYLVTAKPARLIRCVPTIGWHNGVYVLPDASYGHSAEEMTLQTASPDTLFRTRGTLEDWQKHVGRYCAGNSRLMFATCAGIAAPLLHLCGLEGGGVHFLGSSSIGKSMLLLVAGSVAGGGGQSGFLRRWRATDNALESVALAHNDALLCLDEIGQVASRVAGETSYMLANGQGKARATKDGLVRPLAEWRLIFLSNGELSLEQKIQEEGRRYMAGQAVRVLDIPADAGCGHGIFECLHGFADGKAFAEHLHRAATAFFGTPLRAFLSCAVEDLQATRCKARELLQNYEQQLTQSGHDGQINRAAKRFALFAAAGELATALGVFPWESGASLWAAKRCFQDWIAFRGGLGAAEAREAIRRVRAFIAANRTSRFEPWERGGPDIIHNSVGFRRESGAKIEFMIYRDAFKEICLGGDSKAIARYLAEAGYLETDGAGNLAKAHTPPRLGKTIRLYTVTGEILDSEE